MNVIPRMRDDRRAYLDLLCEFGEKHGVAFRGCCLMLPVLSVSKGLP